MKIAMLHEYIQAAMDRAQYDLIDQPEDPYFGSIPELQGVVAVGATLEECRRNLEDALEGWLVLGMQLGHEIPKIRSIRFPRAKPPIR